MREWFKHPDEVWESPIIRNRLAQEAAFENKSDLDRYHMIVPVKNGKRDIKNYTPDEVMNIPPHPDQMMFASDIMEGLNKLLHHDGHWIVGWVSPPPTSNILGNDPDNVWAKLLFVFLDEHCDVKFAWDAMRSVDDMIRCTPINYYLEMSEQAWQAWNDQFGNKVMKDDLGLSDDQITHATLESIH